MNQLNAYMALEIMHDSLERAERERRARPSPQQPPAGGARRPSRHPPAAAGLRSAASRSGDAAPLARHPHRPVTLICRPEAEKSVAPAGAAAGYS